MLTLFSLEDNNKDKRINLKKPIEIESMSESLQLVHRNEIIMLNHTQSKVV